jgi:N-acetylglucosaminyldiphosphoundecaprenol N-acetyl-beta-D-mannosaminyltransferase
MHRKRITLFGQTIDNVDTETALTFVEEYLHKRDQKIICAKNVALVVECNRDAFLREFYENADLVTVDGRPLVYLSRFFGDGLPEMVGGPRLWFKIIELAQRRGYSVYLLGGTQSVVEKATDNLLGKYPGLRIAGFRNGYFRESETPNVIRELRNQKPDILLLGLPTPMKERLALLISQEIPSSLCVAVGGVFDVFAGEKQLAHPIVSKICMEWLYRMMQDPKRLLMRYLRTNSLFFLLLIQETKRKLF